MSIRWITELLGTAPAADVRGLAGIVLVDVRDLVDKTGNSPEIVKAKILEGVSHLQAGSKTIICCDYGISRSNAVAAGVLATHGKLSFWEAVRLVQERTGEAEIKLGPLDVVRRALGEAGRKIGDKGKRTILVTGASGFLGTAVCKRLENQFEVIGPTRAQLDVEQGSTQLSLMVAEHAVDCIIHLANPRIYTSNISLGKTLTMLRNVLEVCALHDIPLVYPSSWEVYSGYSGSLLANEMLPAYPSGPYGDTKYLAELLIQQFQKTSSLVSTVIRSGPLYGAGSDKPKFIYNFLGKARRSETISTHRYLNGDARLDLLHISDFVDAISRICEQNYSGTINIGTSITTSTRDIAEMLKVQTGSQSKIEQIQINTHAAFIAMDYEKARRELGWQPKIELQQGLQALLESDSERDQSK